MLQEIYPRKIKSITGNGSTKIKITPTPGQRLYSLQMEASYVGGTNTLAAMMTNLTQIRVKVGTSVLWRLNGTQLRDFCLLHGATFDFNGLPNTGCQITIPLAPEWFLPGVQDLLAWNPALLGGDITVEIDSAAALTIADCYEMVNDNLKFPSIGVLTLEVINPVAGGKAFFVQKELEIKGSLISASVYPDSTNANEITPCSLFVGKDDSYAFEALTSAQNDERLERFGLTPAAAGRTANIFDMVFAQLDGLERAINLPNWGSAKIKVEAAAAMAGTCDIVLARLVK